MNRDKNAGPGHEGGHYIRRHDIKAEFVAQRLQREAVELLGGVDFQEIDDIPRAVFLKLMVAQAIAPTKYGKLAFDASKELASMAGMNANAGTQSEMARRFEEIINKAMNEARATSRAPAGRKRVQDRVPDRWPPE